MSAAAQLYVCCACRELLPLGSFHRALSTPWRPVQSYCVPCKKLRSVSYGRRARELRRLRRRAPIVRMVVPSRCHCGTVRFGGGVCPACRSEVTS